MAITAEAVFRESIALAAGTRQQAIAAAWVTYTAAGMTPGAMATYITANSAAEDAYDTAVIAARLTSALPIVNQGQTGPIPTRWASLVGMY
jgi:hypothetical protein